VSALLLISIENVALRSEDGKSKEEGSVEKRVVWYTYKE
jgi:hypothetical protein